MGGLPEANDLRTKRPTRADGQLVRSVCGRQLREHDVASNGPQASPGPRRFLRREIRVSSDYDLYLRIAAHYDCTFINEPLWRYVPTSVSGAADRRRFRWNETVLPCCGSTFDEIVAFAGVADFIDTQIKRYSSRMSARLGFSIAAHLNPDVLIIDEVLSVGDMAFQRRCVERMEDFRRQGVAIVFVSHQLQAIATLCGQALYLQQEVRAIGPTARGNQVVRREYRHRSRRSDWRRWMFRLKAYSTRAGVL